MPRPRMSKKACQNIFWTRREEESTNALSLGGTQQLVRIWGGMCLHYLTHRPDLPYHALFLLSFHPRPYIYALFLLGFHPRPYTWVVDFKDDGTFLSRTFGLRLPCRGRTYHPTEKQMHARTRWNHRKIRQLRAWPFKSPQGIMRMCVQFYRCYHAKMITWQLIIAWCTFWYISHTWYVPVAGNGHIPKYSRFSPLCFSQAPPRYLPCRTKDKK